MSSKARAFNIVFHLQTISPGHATVYSPHFLKTGNEMKRRENRKNREKTSVSVNLSRQREHCKIISSSQLNRGLLQRMCFCLCLYIHVQTMHECTDVHLHLCICACVCVGVCSCVYPCAWLVWVLRAFAVVLKMKGIVFTYTHIHLQISLRLPACPHAGDTHFSSSLCWALLPAPPKSALLKYSLTSFNRGWFTGLTKYFTDPQTNKPQTVVLH